MRRACELHSGAIAAAADQARMEADQGMVLAELAELAGGLARLQSQMDGGAGPEELSLGIIPEEELEEKPLASVPEESDAEECDIHTTEEEPLGRASLDREPLSSSVTLKVVRACSPETDGAQPKTSARTPEVRLSLTLTLALTRS